MELGILKDTATHMNRKSSQSPTKAVRKTKANRKKSALSKNRGLSKLNQKQISPDRPKIKSSPKAIAKKAAAVKRNPTPQTNSKPSGKKLPLPWLAICAIAIAWGISTILGTTIAIALEWQTPVVESKTVTQNKSSNAGNRANKIQQLLLNLDAETKGIELQPL